MNADAAPTNASAAPAGLRIEPVAAFRDNYIWMLAQGARAVLVDPGEAEPARRALAANGLALDAILVTHHHPDHVGGVAELAGGAAMPIYGPPTLAGHGVNRPVRDGDRIQVLGCEFRVLAVPGHTLDHLAYWSPALAALFCGDTLFAGGCGRLFEGSAAQMYASLQRLASLPDETRVYCAHEYTLANLRFARELEPDNAALQRRQQECQGLRDRGVPTVPSQIALEKATNPFLRCDQPAVRANARIQLAPGADDAAVFAAIRAWKDRF
jgi:hydroxyacylglutathione hydrolase